MRNRELIFSKRAFLSVVFFLFCQQLALAESPLKNAIRLAEASFKKLQAGNARFAKWQLKHPHLTQARLFQTFSAGQKPFVSILSCSDSRVPVELIFDQGIGDIFVVRVAGNVVGGDEVGSIEYGALHLKTPLLVVLGHTECGAVTAATQQIKDKGALQKLLKKIRPVVDQVVKKNPQLRGTSLINAVIGQNVFYAIQQILINSSLVRQLVRSRQLKIIGAVYHLEKGKVEWLGPHPKEASLIDKSPIPSVQ